MQERKGPAEEPALILARVKKQMQDMREEWLEELRTSGVSKLKEKEELEARESLFLSDQVAVSEVRLESTDGEEYPDDSSAPER